MLGPLKEIAGTSEAGETLAFRLSIVPDNVRDGGWGLSVAPSSLITIGNYAPVRDGENYPCDEVAPTADQE